MTRPPHIVIQVKGKWEVHDFEGCIATCPDEAVALHIAYALETHPVVQYTLKDILDSLPQKRDWLNPDTEKIAKWFVTM